MQITDTNTLTELLKIHLHLGPLADAFIQSDQQYVQQYKQQYITESRMFTEPSAKPQPSLGEPHPRVQQP